MRFKQGGSKDAPDVAIQNGCFIFQEDLMSSDSDSDSNPSDDNEDEVQDDEDEEEEEEDDGDYRTSSGSKIAF